MIAAILTSLLGIAILVLLALRFIHVAPKVDHFWNVIDNKFPKSRTWWFNGILLLLGIGLSGSITAQLDAMKYGMTQEEYKAAVADANSRKIPFDDYVNQLKISNQLGFKKSSEYFDAKSKGFENPTDYEDAKKVGASNLQEYLNKKADMARRGISDIETYVKTIQAEEAEKEKEKLKANLSNAKWLDSEYGVAASLSCSRGADDYLREYKYAFKWDDTGFLEAKFDSYLVRVSAPGVITVTSNKVSLQNGFGAYQRITLACDYDTQKREVLGYWVK